MTRLLLPTVALFALATTTAAVSRAGDVKTIADVAYVSGTGADEKHKLDLYLPADKKEYPIVLFVHGGGYRKGDRKNVANFGKAMAAEGVGVAAVGYRLFPKVKHPEQIGDVAKAFVWLKDNAAKYGGSPKKLFLAGHSAGGHLVALLGADPTYLKAEKASLADVKGVIALAGYYKPRAKDVFGDALESAAPIKHVKEGVPAYLLLYSEKESEGLPKHSDDLAKAIRGEKSEAESKLIKGRDHGTLFSKIAADEPVGQAILGFVKKQAGM